MMIIGEDYVCVSSVRIFMKGDVEGVLHCTIISNLVHF